jgi:hypothetical protein
MKRTVKTLTVRQPWAYLIVNGHKDIENRTWSTAYRGPILIQSSKTYGSVMELSDNCLWIEKYARPRLTLPQNFTLGIIEGIVTLSDIKRDVRSFWADPDCYHWLLANPIPLDLESVSIKGKLGLWDLPLDLLQDKTAVTTIKEYLNR